MELTVRRGGGRVGRRRVWGVFYRERRVVNRRTEWGEDNYFGVSSGDKGDGIGIGGKREGRERKVS